MASKNNLSKVISTAIKLAPIVYPIIKKIIDQKKATSRK